MHNKHRDLKCINPAGYCPMTDCHGSCFLRDCKQMDEVSPPQSSVPWPLVVFAACVALWGLAWQFAKTPPL